MASRKRRAVAPATQAEVVVAAPEKDVSRNTTQMRAGSAAPVGAASEKRTLEALLQLVAENGDNAGSERTAVTVKEVKAALEWAEATKRFDKTRKRAHREQLRQKLVRAVQADEEDAQAAAFETELPPLAPQHPSSQEPAAPPPPPAPPPPQQPTEPLPPLQMVQLPPAPALPLPSAVDVPAPLSAVAQGKQPIAHTTAVDADVAVPAAVHACVERRRDSDGEYYTFAEFVEFHGACEQDAAAAGMRAWQCAASTSTKLERRVDTSHLGDGNAYTYDEFVHFYAGYDSFGDLGKRLQWELAGKPQLADRAQLFGKAQLAAEQLAAALVEAALASAVDEVRRRCGDEDEPQWPSDEPSPDQLVMAVMGPAPLTESDFDETVVSRAFLQMAADFGFVNELMADIVSFGLAVETSARTYADYVDECVEDDLDPERGNPRRKKRLTEAEFDAMFPHSHHCAAR
jgi:hypothetical protein